MLDAGTHAIALHTIDISGSHDTSYDRIFGVVFKVAPTERRALDVHTGSQEHIAAILQHLVANGLTYLLN